MINLSEILFGDSKKDSARESEKIGCKSIKKILRRLFGSVR